MQDESHNDMTIFSRCEHFPSEKKSDEFKITKHMSLYQIMYYILHGENKKRPQHIMASHYIYEKCNSRELIATFNAHEL